MVNPADELLSDPRLLATLTLAHQAIEFQDGITHTAVKLTERGPMIVEINGRLGGDFVLLLARYASGIEPGAVAVDVATGRPPRIPAAVGRCAGIRFAYPPHDCVVDSVSVPEPCPQDRLLEAGDWPVTCSESAVWGFPGFACSTAVPCGAPGTAEQRSSTLCWRVTRTRRSSEPGTARTVRTPSSRFREGSRGSSSRGRAPRRGQVNWCGSSSSAGWSACSPPRCASAPGRRSASWIRAASLPRWPHPTTGSASCGQVRAAHRPRHRRPRGGAAAAPGRDRAD